MISETKPLKIKSTILFNFITTKTCVAICLAEDVTGMGGIQFQVSPSNLSNPSTNVFLLTKSPIV